MVLPLSLLLLLAWGVFILSSVPQEIADIKRELAAIKAGFKGTPVEFTGATLTSQSFTITPTTSMIITVDFEYTEYPELYVSGVRLLPSAVIYVGYAHRRSLYEWYIEYDVAFGTVRWDCLLISENPPTLFTLTQVS